MCPDGYTLRELLWMQEGRSRAIWSVASCLLSAIHGVLGKGPTPAECNPWTAKDTERRARSRGLADVAKAMEATGYGECK